MPVGFPHNLQISLHYQHDAGVLLLRDPLSVLFPQCVFPPSVHSHALPTPTPVPPKSMCQSAFPTPPPDTCTGFARSLLGEQ